MAQKSLKTLAARNTATLNRARLIALAIHALYHTSRLLLSSTRRTLLPYILLTLPSLGIQLLFERTARPTFDNAGNLKTAGEDLEAEGLTEWMWDVTYWTWVCVVVVAGMGDRGWWLWTIVPAYSVYLAVTTYTGMKSGLGGMMGGAGQEGGADKGQSKRQAKLEKRGGQRVSYR